MSPPTVQGSEDTSPPMDLEQIRDDLTPEAGQNNTSMPVPFNELADVQPHTSVQTDFSSEETHLTLAQRNPAFRAALEEAKKSLPSMRGGEARGCIIDDKSCANDENADAQPRHPDRKPKIPLAEQGAAFKAALSQSQQLKEAIPSDKWAHPKAWKWTKAMREEAAAAAAESPRLAALKAQKAKEKKARKKERKRQQKGENEQGE